MDPKSNESLTDQIIHTLEKRIIEKNLQPGDFFSTEEQLCQELDVSRGIMREAVSRLRGIGVLESKKKVGLILGYLNPMDLFEEVFAYYNCVVTDLDQLSEMRFALETGAIELAVKKATEEQIQELERLSNKFEQLVNEKSDTHQLDEVDESFHKLILAATNNELIYRMHGVIITHFKRMVRNYEKESSVLNGISKLGPTIMEHKMIVESFRVRDPEQARHFLTIHLKRVVQPKVSSEAHSEAKDDNKLITSLHN